MNKAISPKPFYANTRRAYHDVHGYIKVITINKFNGDLYIRLRKNQAWSTEMIWVNPKTISHSFSMN